MSKNVEMAKGQARPPKPRVVLTTRFHEASIREMLEPHARVTLAPTPKQVARELARGADALISMVDEPVDATLLKQARGLRVVGKMAVGLDNVDLQACADLKIRVVNTPRVVTRATAETALALLLAAARRIPEADRLCRRPGAWTWTPSLLLGLELKGRHAVLVGRGRIGKETARLFRGIGLTTEFISSTDSGTQIRQKLKRAQILSLHVPLKPLTHHWLNAARLALLPRDAILVNTARGPVIDELALISTLQRQRIFAAGLDVHEHEPRIHPAFKRLPNAVLLPHIGTGTFETRRAMAELVIGGVLGVLAGQHPWNEVSLTRYVKRGR